MMAQVALFVAVSSVVGLVNLVLSEPMERGFLREFASFVLVVMGGIAAFTTIVVLIAALFQ